MGATPRMEKAESRRAVSARHWLYACRDRESGVQFCCVCRNNTGGTFRYSCRGIWGRAVCLARLIGKATTSLSFRGPGKLCAFPSVFMSLASFFFSLFLFFFCSFSRAALPIGFMCAVCVCVCVCARARACVRASVRECVRVLCLNLVYNNTFQADFNCFSL